MKSIQMTVRDGHWVSVEPAGEPEGTGVCVSIPGLSHENWRA